MSVHVDVGVRVNGCWFHQITFFVSRFLQFCGNYNNCGCFVSVQLLNFHLTHSQILGNSEKGLQGKKWGEERQKLTAHDRAEYKERAEDAGRLNVRSTMIKVHKMISCKNLHAFELSLVLLFGLVHMLKMNKSPFHWIQPVLPGACSRKD
ncbi:hypothetical protein BaRGS_00006242 [Batillaria attramentaria]|uniref:Uncharacterized protein n=1 Tax=Batillaria attramentaria TaxID=370345 RepID=A0ABD0LRW3_9CAEN